MLILAIESSCDETSASIVRDGKEVISLEIGSSVLEHGKTGGIVPEIAARDHVVKMKPVLENCINNACKKLSLSRDELISEIDAIAVTNGPGLVGSLLSGVVAAQTLAFAWKKPLIPVHHISGHIYANWIGRDDDVQFPCLILTVSGGHNELVLMKGHDDFKIIGETLDDAAGEAFDKVGKLLGLGFPGGPAISKAAKKGRRDAFDLPRPMKHSKDYDFSFSGLKTAVAVALSKEEKPYTEDVINNMSASFEEAVCDSLISKLSKAVDNLEIKEVHLSGGVSANPRLREMLYSKMDSKGVSIKTPEEIVFCTDNAAMIATAAFYKGLEGAKDWKDVGINLSFDF
jgi:N6-L-threonylcarbamoyladenine synthase